MKRGAARVLRWFGLLELGRRAELRARMGQNRGLPDAVILGAQKSGTSSLHNYLVQHPGVIEPLRKEVHYFDLNHERDVAWYRAHFGRSDEPGLNLDSSPYYLFHPAVPRRLVQLLPEAKPIVLLRDPVRRAYSHYWHERDKGRESLSFEDAIAAEADRLGTSHEQLAEQLERWFEVLPRERFLLLRFEELARDPLAVLNRTLACLGLPEATAVSLEARNTRRYPPLAEATAARLRDYFAPHNRRLEALLGESPGW